MAKKYELSPASRLDLIDIEDSTFERFGIEQALLMNDEFVATFEKLAENPDIGHLREDLSPLEEEFLYWPVKNTFLIVYRVRAQTVEIVRVLHGRRHVEALLRRSEE